MKPFLIAWIALVTSRCHDRLRRKHTEPGKNVMTEIAFTSAVDRDDPFNQATLDVVFTEPGGRERRVPGVLGGRQDLEGALRLANHRHAPRFARSAPTRRTRACMTSAALVEVDAYRGDKPPLLPRGPFRVANGGRYLEYADGTPFLLAR